MIEHLVLYHEDNDGFCSAAIVAKYLKIFKVKEDEVKFYGIDYHKVDKFLDWFENSTIRNTLKTVIILDFSFGPNWGKFLSLFPMEKIVWIDHHKTAVQNGYDTNIIHSYGSRDGSNDVAACGLTWKYFFPGKPAPWVVKLVEDYDIWKFAYSDDTWAFFYSSQSEGKHITNPQSKLWEVLLNEDGEDNYSQFLSSILRDGNVIYKYVKSHNAEICKVKAYISFYGKSDIKCVVCNYGRGSAIFDSVTDDYDMMVIYWFDGKQYNYSFYSKEDGIDVSIIAKEHGGGGHFHAAGCRSEKMLFPKYKEVRWTNET
jgi:oligoribonuclease NrnB/cAMP/cGMP phosphodiesterase (DHH superfamily)